MKVFLEIILIHQEARSKLVSPFTKVKRSSTNVFGGSEPRESDHMSETKIEELKKQIAELKDKWPKHSVPPAMLQQLDELEEQLEVELRKSRDENSTPEISGLETSG
jgi:hypothetical protein